MRVVLVDEQRLFRDGLGEMLAAQGHRVAGQAATAREGVRVAGEARADLVVIDIRLAGGAAAIAAMRGASPASAVAVLTDSTAAADMTAAFKAGAAGYLLKDSPAGELLEGLQVVGTGGVAIAAPVLRELVEHIRTEPEPPPRGDPVRLADRELEVLRLLVAGRNNAEIARELSLGIGTVKGYVAGILRKLGAANRVEAAVAAVRRGLA
jgi:DNA-binding NarL/FixJ family response regulator